MSRYDYTTYDPAKESFPMLPLGWHTLVIDIATEKISGKGHPMMQIDCHAVNDGNGVVVDENISIRHWVTFLPVDQQGAGIAVHFLKCIGLPLQGELNAMDWEGRSFKGKIINETYEGKTRNKIKEVSPLPDNKNKPVASVAVALDEDILF